MEKIMNLWMANCCSILPIHNLIMGSWTIACSLQSISQNPGIPRKGITSWQQIVWGGLNFVLGWSHANTPQLLPFFKSRVELFCFDHPIYWHSFFLPQFLLTLPTFNLAGLKVSLHHSKNKWLFMEVLKIWSTLKGLPIWNEIKREGKREMGERAAVKQVVHPASQKHGKW